MGKGQVYLAMWLSGKDTLDQAAEQFSQVIDEF